MARRLPQDLSGRDGPHLPRPDFPRQRHRPYGGNHLNNSSARSSNVGGVQAAAKIMNFAKVDMETQVMAGLMGLDEEMALQIQDQMFTFDNLLDVDNKAIQVIMRNVDQDLLMTALKGASDAVKEKFFDNMSSRARVMFIDDMEAKGPMRITDVEEAQKTIMRTARKLSDAGELVLAGGGGDGFV